MTICPSDHFIWSALLCNSCEDGSNALMPAVWGLLAVATEWQLELDYLRQKLDNCVEAR